MKLLVNDTETNGLPLFKEPSEDPRQPHIVQLAAMLIDEGPVPVTLDKMNRIIRPDGWSWDDSEGSEDKAFQAHGITMERAMDEGVPEAEAIEEFHALQLQCDMRVAHNGSFDDRIYRIAYKRHGAGNIVSRQEDGTPVWKPMSQEERDIVADTYRMRPSFCTMKHTVNVLQLPPTDRMRGAGFGYKFKVPKLTESFAHYFGFVFDGAHDAMNDVHACADVYFAIQRGITTPIYTARPVA